jgi:hypothetical protein
MRRVNKAHRYIMIEGRRGEPEHFALGRIRENQGSDRSGLYLSVLGTVIKDAAPLGHS